MTKPILTQAELKQLLHYDPETGVFVNIQTGKTVGSKHSKGYLETSISNKRYYVHRLVFLYIDGCFPKQVDHIN